MTRGKCHPTRSGLLRTTRLGYAAAIAAAFLSTAAAAKCRLLQSGTIQVDMEGMQPIVSTKINGATARFLLDTGDFYSLMWSGAAARYGLSSTHVVGGPAYVEGAGGISRASKVIVKSFEFIGAPISNAQFLLVSAPSEDPVGLLGQNFLRMSDVEFDLADGIVRFFKPVDCEGQPLAYWAVSTPYTSVEMHSLDATDNHLGTTAIINGQRMTVWLDTGTTHSFLSADAAARIGITSKTPGVTPIRLGTRTFVAWSAPVDSFQLGGEKVEHAHLLIANWAPRVGTFGFKRTPDLLLGADFFLSHRIYVAYSQKTIYFTYNGGPLFNLDLPQVISGKATPPATLDMSSHATAGRQTQLEIPTDADGFRRRGMAYSSMRDFDRAIADLTRACGLAPSDARNYYERGQIYRQDKQLKQALDDFGAAIRLRPDYMEAYLARAQLLQSEPGADARTHAADIKSDLDAASRLAAPAANVRLTLANAYKELGDYSDALDQQNQWLSTHPREQAIGLGDRCWLRAATNRDLEEALKDCSHAIDLAPTPYLLDSRGLVYLRLGIITAAITDYTTALDADPNIASALYGRGLAELRQARETQGQADLAAAEKLDPDVAQRFAKMGLAP